MPKLNFSARMCNKIGFGTYNGQKEKQSRKGQAESTAQPNKFLTKSKETDNNDERNFERRNLEG